MSVLGPLTINDDNTAKFLSRTFSSPDSNELASSFPGVQYLAAVLRPLLVAAGHPLPARALLPRPDRLGPEVALQQRREGQVPQPARGWCPGNPAEPDRPDGSEQLPRILQVGFNA